MTRCISFISRISGSMGLSEAKNLLQKSGTEIPENFTVTAHTGAMLTPHNSMKSVSTSIVVGADIVEIDVTFRKDGTVVIIHSDSPADNEGVLFAEVADKLVESSTVRANLDLKAFWNTAGVQEILLSHNLLERAFYTGVFPENVEQVRKGSPLVPYYINGSIDKTNMDNEEFLHAFAKEITDLGAIGLNTHFSCINKKVTDIMHDHGLLVSAWTVNKRSDQCRILSYGVNNITTTNPVKLRTILDAVKK